MWLFVIPLLLMPHWTHSIFFFRPVTQRVAPGSSVHQACGTTNEPVFIEWFQNQQKIGSCLFQSNTTTSSISSMKFKLFIGRQSNRPVCHLAINDAQYEQTGQYTCKTVHANSDGEMASATVLVFTPILDLRLKLENETSLVVDESAYVECVARGGKPLPKLRLQLGGEPVSNVGFAQRTDSPGVTVSTLTANIQLRSSHNWNLLTCHADMDVYGSVNQTFKVIYVQGYQSIEL